VNQLKMNEAAVTALRNSPEMVALMDRVADRVASNAENLAGSAEVGAGKGSVRVPIEMRRTSYDTGLGLDDPPRNRSRARSAVLVSHPTPTGRERGMRALLSALDAGVGL
jgi:hypothetical protein